MNLESPFEFLKQEKSETTKTIEAKKAEGWHYVGQENLLWDKFQMKTGRFEPVQYQTEEEIVERYRKQFETQAREAGEERIVEIELVPKPLGTFRGDPLTDRYKGFLVFARVKEQK